MTYLDIVFDGPPGPQSGRFVEVEDPYGCSFDAGEWIDRGNGVWALRIEVARLGRLMRINPNTRICSICRRPGNHNHACE